MPVSVPEKTLEHWSSQYLTYRYNSQAALWWPATGEDINVGWLPSRPGKAVQLELKTTTVATDGNHEVMVDLGQLWDYAHRPLGYQPFYAFPQPDWKGELHAAALDHGRAVTELGFRRSGAGWWFADWMRVLPTAQVADALRHELAAHGSGKRGVKRCLVRFDSKGAVTAWGKGRNASGPELITWTDFWYELNSCGRLDWPQLLRVPAQFVRALNAKSFPYDRSQISALFREAIALHAADVELATLAPSGRGLYSVTKDYPDTSGRLGSNEFGQPEDHRVAVFLDAQALSLA